MLAMVGCRYRFESECGIAEGLKLIEVHSGAILAQCTQRYTFKYPYRLF